MKYTVVWTATAEHSLTQIWLAASNHAEFTQAATDIDHLIAADPENMSCIGRPIKGRPIKFVIGGTRRSSGGRL